MEYLLNERGVVCEPRAWMHDGAELAPHDRKHTCEWRVLERGDVRGLIIPDRGFSHPQMMWKRVSARHDDIDGDYKTVEEAFAAFVESTIRWVIERQPDSTFLMWKSASQMVPLKAYNAANLEIQGYPNHIVGDVLQDALAQLENGDTAVIDVPLPPRFVQVDFLP